MSIPKIIIAIGILLSSFILADALLPKQKEQVTVLEIVEVWEPKDDESGKMQKTSARVALSNGVKFPISLANTHRFKPGVQAELSRSQMLNSPTFLKNLATGFEIKPFKGIFSFFLAFPLALAISSALGVYYKDQYTALNNCCVFIVFFTLGTLVVLLLF